MASAEDEIPPGGRAYAFKFPFGILEEAQCSPDRDNVPFLQPLCPGEQDVLPGSGRFDEAASSHAHELLAGSQRVLDELQDMAAADEVEACVTEWQLLHVGEDEGLPVRDERHAPPHVHFHEPIGQDRCVGKWVATVANVENPFSGSDVEAHVLASGS